MDITDNDVRQAFDLAKLKNIPNSTYAYFPITNLYLLNQCHIDIDDMSDKILIYDKNTYYFNLSTFVGAFGMNESKKQASNYTRTKEYKSNLAIIEEEINSLPESVKRKYHNTKLYNANTNWISAAFQEKSTKHSPTCTGIFVHSDMLTYVLMWCNPRIAIKINKLVMFFLIHQGVNNTVKVEEVVSNELKAIKHDATDRKEYIRHMIMNTQDNNDSRFNAAVLEEQMHATAKKYSVTRSKQLKKKIKECVNKQIILVRYFDEDEYIYEPDMPNDLNMMFKLIVVNVADVNKEIEKNTCRTFDKKTGEENVVSIAYPVTMPLISTFPYTSNNINDTFFQQYNDDIYLMNKGENMVTDDFVRLKELIVDFANEYICLEKY